MSSWDLSLMYMISSWLILSHIRHSFDAVRKALGAKPGLGGLVTQLRQIVVEVNIPNKILNIPSLSEMQAMPSTASMSVFLHKRQEQAILRNGTWTKSQAARLQSQAVKGSGDWMRVSPSLPCFRSPSDLFAAMLRTRLQDNWSGAESVAQCECLERPGDGGALHSHQNCKSLICK